MRASGRCSGQLWCRSDGLPVLCWFCMPRSGMEAPAGVEYGTVSEWRRSPAQPVISLTGFTNQPLLPVRLKPAKSDTVMVVRCRSGHDKAKPQSGRISALAGRKGRLRACYAILPATSLTATQNLVTSSGIKNYVVSGPSGRGGLAFQCWEGLGVGFLLRFLWSKFWML